MKSERPGQLSSGHFYLSWYHACGFGSPFPSWHHTYYLNFVSTLVSLMTQTLCTHFLLVPLLFSPASEFVIKFPKWITLSFTDTSFTSHRPMSFIREMYSAPSAWSCLLFPSSVGEITSTLCFLENTLELAHHLRYCLQDSLSLLPIRECCCHPTCTFSLSCGYTSNTSFIASLCHDPQEQNRPICAWKERHLWSAADLPRSFRKAPFIGVHSAPEEFGAGRRSALPRPTPL